MTAERVPNLVKRRVPSYLIREIINDKPYFYKGYRDVLAKRKTIEEIMGSSVLQAFIIHILDAFLRDFLNRKEFLIATSEAGVHFGRNDNAANDIAVYRFEHIKNLFSVRYFDIPAELVIEVDVKVELEKNQEIEYVVEKTEKMIQAGTKQVLWFLTKPKKVLIAKEAKNWTLHDWDVDIKLFEGSVLNIKTLLDEYNLGNND